MTSIIKDSTQRTRVEGGRVHYIKDYIPTHLKHDKPDSVLLQCGGNDLQDAYTPELMEKLADDIVDAGLICRNDKNVDSVYIGGITLRRKMYTWERCREVNRMLKERCDRYGFVFVDNSNISLNHLHQDGVHLNLEGTGIMANNFLQCLDADCHN